MIPNDMKAVADDLMQLENLMPLLKEASNQMELMRKKIKSMEAGDTDVMGPELPKSLAPIVPLLNRYYEDRFGWYLFVRYLRDNGPWSNASATWKKVQTFMRDQHSNALQHRDRDLAERAAVAKETAEGKFPKGERVRYKNAVMAYVKARIARRENNAWAESGLKHFPLDERMAIKEQVRNEIEEELNAGKYPDPRLVMDEL